MVPRAPKQSHRSSNLASASASSSVPQCPTEKPRHSHVFKLLDLLTSASRSDKSLSQLANPSSSYGDKTSFVSLALGGSMRAFLLAALLVVCLGLFLFPSALAQQSSPQITVVAPTSARAGDQIAISGSGFGASQSSGNVWLGSAYGVVVSC